LTRFRRMLFLLLLICFLKFWEAYPMIL